jgi:hypothetical protein
LVVNAILRLFDGTNFNLARGSTSNSDGVSVVGTNALVNATALLRGFNSSTIDRLRTASAANQSSSAGAGVTGALLNRKGGDWSVVDFPATNAIATATKAAGGASVRHILTGFCFTLSGAAAAATALVRCDVLDGATPIFSGVLSAVANETAKIEFEELSLVGSLNTAMVIQFSAAGGAGTQEAVSMFGYSIS